MAVTHNETIVRSLLAAFNAGDVEGTIAFYHPEMTNHGRINGPEGMRVVHETILCCYPDLNQEVVDMVSDGDKVVARLFTRGTHLGVPDGPIESTLFGGVLQGAPPTGRWMEIQAIHMWKLRDGMVIAHWANRDDVGMKKQLGL